MEEIKTKISDEIKKSGIKMSKKISSGGFFSTSTYDNRIAYSYEKA
jgi:hypothetical protein